MFSSSFILRLIYLIFACAGAILPTISNIKFIKSYGPGFDINTFISMASANPAAESLSRDLFIGATVVIIWIISETRRLKMKNLWIVLLSSVTIAFAFAVPFFLYLRELRLIELEKEGLKLNI